MAEENNFATTPSSTAPAASGQIGSATPEQLGDLKRPENWCQALNIKTLITIHNTRLVLAFSFIKQNNKWRLINYGRRK